MTNKLKPCPCCGGKAGLYDTFRHYVVQCKECGLTTLKMIDEQKAIETWNTRYERTCKPIDEYCCGVPSCGECGVTLNMVVGGVRPFDKVLPNFCYNCGARVMGD